MMVANSKKYLLCLRSEKCHYCNSVRTYVMEEDIIVMNLTLYWSCLYLLKKIPILLCIIQSRMIVYEQNSPVFLIKKLYLPLFHSPKKHLILQTWIHWIIPNFENQFNPWVLSVALPYGSLIFERIFWRYWLSSWVYWTISYFNLIKITNY